MKSKIIISIVFVLFLFSCKKNDPQKPTANSSNPAGLLYTSRHTFDTTYPIFPSDSISYTDEAVCEFFDYTSGVTVGILVDTVYLNGVGLDIIPNDSGVYDAYYGIFDDLNSNCSWDVVGSGTIPSFAYNHSTPFPNFTGALPAGFAKSNGVTFNIQFTNADSVVIELWGDSLSANAIISKSFLPSSSFTFNPNEVATLYTSSALSFRNIFTIKAYNHTIQTLSGKNFYFMKTLEYTGGIWVY